MADSEDAFIAELFQNGIGCGALPAQTLLTELTQLAGLDGLVLPDDGEKTVLGIEQFLILFHHDTSSLLKIDC